MLSSFASWCAQKCFARTYLKLAGMRGAAVAASEHLATLGGSCGDWLQSGPMGTLAQLANGLKTCLRCSRSAANETGTAFPRLPRSHGLARAWCNNP